MDEFALERLHLRVRGPIEHVDTMQSFEKSVVAAVSNEQARRLNLKRSQGGLVGATHRCKDARFSKQASFNGASYAAGDVIVSMLQDRCGEVSAAALFDDGDEYVLGLRTAAVTARRDALAFGPRRVSYRRWLGTLSTATSSLSRCSLGHCSRHMSGPS